MNPGGGNGQDDDGATRPTASWAEGEDPWAVPSQQRAASVLRAAASTGEVGHAWAFLGPTGVGQRRLGRALAAALGCEAPPTAGQPCAACATCLRIARGADPSIFEHPRTATMHRVEDVRSVWLADALRSGAPGAWKIIHIEEADRMNDPAANAFLKGLEEPPPRTVWVLDIADPDELPDTIMSRCRTVRVAPWTWADLDARARALGVDDPTDRALAVRTAEGSPEVLARRCRPAETVTVGRGAKAREVVHPSGLDDLRRHRSWLGRIRTEGPGAALSEAFALDAESKQRTAAAQDEAEAALAVLAESYGDEIPREIAKNFEAAAKRREREARGATTTDALDDVLGWIRDAVAVASGAETGSLRHVDAVPELRADADAYGVTSLLAVADRITEIRLALDRNVSGRVAVEAIGMDLHARSLAGNR